MYKTLISLRKKSLGMVELRRIIKRIRTDCRISKDLHSKRASKVRDLLLRSI